VEGIKRRRHLDENAWRDVFGRFAQGDESVSAFCQREGLNTSSFHRWRARLGPTGSGRRVSATPAKSDGAAMAGFVELGTLPAPPAGRLELKLDLGGGVTLHVVRG
jgi:putative transposase